MGPKVVSELFKYFNLALNKVALPFAKTKTVLVDLYKQKERHIYIKST